MSWEDRLQEAAYTPPSGTRFTYAYEDVSVLVNKKTTGFEFPDARGTLVQDLGPTGRRYPLKFIFWGEDHDLEANSFEDALLETGVALLEHPIYGTINVVPFGEIKREDKLKTAAGQTTIQTVLWETTDLTIPLEQTDPIEIVVATIQEYNEAEATQFEEQTSVVTAPERASLKSQFQALLDTVKSQFQKIADAQKSAKKLFDDTYDSINSTLDVLVNAPLNLAFQAQIFIGAPARALASIQSRLDAAANLFNQTLGTDASRTQALSGLAQALAGSNNLIGGVPAPTLAGAQGVIEEAPAQTLTGIQPGVNTYETFIDTQITGEGAVQSENFNTFKVKELFVMTSVIGQLQSALETQFVTTEEVFDISDLILDLASQVNVWREDNYNALGQIDTGEAYQKFQQAIALGVGFLVQISFSLKQKRTIILDRNRTFIDLSAELYGEIDPRLDFLIETNSLSGSEILELPKGKDIEYYV